MLKLNGQTIDVGRFPDRNLLVSVFRDGKMLVDYTLHEIRQRLNGGKF